MQSTQPADDTTYSVAAATLRAGMLASFAAMLFGLAWWLLSGSPGESNAAYALPFDRILSELLALNPLALLNLGVLLLLATPGLTLLSQLITFSMARNYRFAAITALVGSILLVSLSVSLGWLK